MQCLKNGDGIARSCQFARAGKTGGTGAYHRHLFALFFGTGQEIRFGVGAVPIGNKALQPPDGDAFPFFAADTDRLTLAFLRTDPTADGGQGVICRKNCPCAGKVAIGNPGNKLRDTHSDGTAGAAGSVGTIEAAARFLDGGIFIIAQCYLLKIAAAAVRGLHRHGGGYRGQVGIFIHGNSSFRGKIGDTE